MADDDSPCGLHDRPQPPGLVCADCVLANAEDGRTLFAELERAIAAAAATSDAVRAERDRAIEAIGAICDALDPADADALLPEATASRLSGAEPETVVEIVRQVTGAWRQQIEHLTARLDPAAQPLSDWHEDDGPVLWWRFPVDEEPYVGTPLDSDWPGYHTHWTPLVVPTAEA